MVGMWTMDELVERVRLALADAYPGAPNGRVRDVPDRRAIRWYATTGLVDRPAAMRGRVALYSGRHLLQVVAVKRRQADGHSLAEIQGELAGASDETLSAIARVPGPLLADAAPVAAADPVPDPDQVPAREAIRPRFWATPSPPATAPWEPTATTAPPTAAPTGPTATTPPPTAAPTGPTATTAPPTAVADGPAATPASSASPAASAPAAAPGPSAASARSGAARAARPAAAPAVPFGRAAGHTRLAEDAPDAVTVARAGARTRSEAGGGGEALAVPVAGVGLRGGVVLLLPATPGPLEAADYDDIAAAAEPLLDLLAARGLLTPDPDTHADKGSPS